MTHFRIKVGDYSIEAVRKIKEVVSCMGGDITSETSIELVGQALLKTEAIAIAAFGSGFATGRSFTLPPIPDDPPSEEVTKVWVEKLAEELLTTMRSEVSQVLDERKLPIDRRIDGAVSRVVELERAVGLHQSRLDIQVTQLDSLHQEKVPALETAIRQKTEMLKINQDRGDMATEERLTALEHANRPSIHDIAPGHIQEHEKIREQLAELEGKVDGLHVPSPSRPSLRHVWTEIFVASLATAAGDASDKARQATKVADAAIKQLESLEKGEG